MYKTSNPARFTSIMVTLDPGSLSIPLLKQLLEADKTIIARINTAHDTPAAWNALLQRLERAEVRALVVALVVVCVLRN
jgi:pyruvate kinase